MGVGVLIIVSCLFSVAFCNMQNASSLTADVLIEMGRQSNKVMLELVGTAFQDITGTLEEKLQNREIEVFQGINFPSNETFVNHVCKLMECSHWTEWSKCQLDRYEFGMMARTRQCGVSNKLCTYTNGTARTETQSRVCTWGEGGSGRPFQPFKCPPDYEMVHGQFCLKYVSSGMYQSDATDHCQADGGELIHVDSQAKKEALHDLLHNTHGVGSDAIWINGNREFMAGLWKYTYGDPNPSYDNWKSGEPSNGSSELCKVSEGDPRKWWDRDGSNNYKFVCEIPY